VRLAAWPQLMSRQRAVRTVHSLTVRIIALACAKLSVIRSLPELEYGGDCLELTSGRVDDFQDCEHLVRNYILLIILSGAEFLGHTRRFRQRRCVVLIARTVQRQYYMCVYFVALSVSFYCIFYVSCV